MRTVFASMDSAPTRLAHMNAIVRLATYQLKIGRVVSVRIDFLTDGF